MVDKTDKKRIGTILATVALTMYPMLLVGAQMTPTTNHAIDLKDLPSEVQTLLSGLQSDFQTREQSSLSLRGFSGNNIFSCRGFA